MDMFIWKARWLVLENAKVVVSMGTTTLIVDPHEIANVVGEQGIEYVLLIIW